MANENEHGKKQISELLQQAKAGEGAARDEVLRRTYEELRKIAQGLFRGERRDHTLQATALVNELQVRLLGSDGVQVDNRRQFFAYAVKAMRNLLVDHARSKGRKKRGGDVEKVRLNEVLGGNAADDLDLLALDEALEKLAVTSPRKAEVVTLKFFAGLTGEEVAEILEVSPATVDRDWEVARTWLYVELEGSDKRAGAEG